MPKMELLRDDDTVVSEVVDNDTADAMVKSFNDQATGAYKPQEFPKWVDTPKGPSYVVDQDEEDELHKIKDDEDFVPIVPRVQGSSAAIVTPTYVGDGYGYVDGVRVSDDRVVGADMSVPGMASGPVPAKGPVRSNMEAALQDVTFTTGDHAEALRDVAQRNKDAIAEAAAEGGASGVPSNTSTIATAPDLAGQPVPQNTPATTTDIAVPPDALGVTNSDAVPTSNPRTSETEAETDADKAETPGYPQVPASNP